MSIRRVVLDANIILRAVFGRKVKELLETYAGMILFMSPAICVDDARRHIPGIAGRRGLEPGPFFSTLQEVEDLIQVVEKSEYEAFEERAAERISRRDPEDWDVIAVALKFDISIWTEDLDFFGTGVATWTSDRIEIYLRGPIS